MLEERIHRLITDIYRGSHEIPLQDFKAWAMAKLRQAVPFDSGLWAVADPATREVHNTHLENQPAEMMHDYERFKHTDRLTQAILQSPLRTIDLREVYTDFRTDPAYWEHCVPYRIEHAISTTSPRQVNGLQSVITCYRARRSREFSDSERELKQRLFRDLLEALTINQLLFFTHGAESRTGGGLALCDKHGYLHRSDDAFDRSVRGEWHEWPGLRLPAPMRNLLDHARCGAEYKGMRWVFSLSPLGDLFAVTARQTDCLDRLTPRRREVAQHLAQGRGYREIARLMGLDGGTVAKHANAVYQRLGIHSKAELAALVHGKRG